MRDVNKARAALRSEEFLGEFEFGEFLDGLDWWTQFFLGGKRRELRFFFRKKTGGLGCWLGKPVFLFE